MIKKIKTYLSNETNIQVLGGVIGAAVGIVLAVIISEKAAPNVLEIKNERDE